MSDLSERIANLSPSKRAVLTLRLQKKRSDGSQTETIPRRKDRTSPPPLSFAQQRLWFLDQLEPGNPMYNIISVVRLIGQLDVGILERALSEITRRHESLRTTFSSPEGPPVQIVAPEKRVSLRTVHRQDRSEAEILRLVSEEARRPFDLAQGPLLRAKLLKLAEEDQVLVLVMHHIVSDGWSMGVLIQEMASLYEAYREGRESPLEELPIQYGDFAVWQREWLKGEVLEKQISYWRKQLAGAPKLLELPTDGHRPLIRTMRGSAQTFELGENLSKGLKELCQRQGTTLFMILLASFKVLLHRYSGQQEIVVGTPIANRNRAEIEGLIGFFVNTLVLRVDMQGNPPFTQLLERVKQVAIEAFAYQDLPFEKLVEELNPERDMSHTPLFQMMFVMQNTHQEGIDLPGLKLQLLRADAGTSYYDLSLSITNTEQGIAGLLRYNTDLFNDSIIAQIIRHYQNLLEAIVTNPDQRICNLSLLEQNETRKLLIEWNDTRANYPGHQTIHQLIEAQVERTPDSVAVTFEERQISYRQLNSRANQLARHLQALGVGPESLVGIFMERSLDLVVALLAVLKAGGAYTPLDPSYPQERLAFMLEDSQLRVVLTEERLRQSVPDNGAYVICLDSCGKSIAGYSDESVESKVQPENLAYVIYTSGSTGKPKGAMNTHAGVCNRLRWMLEAYELNGSDRVLQKTPISFDVSVWELFWPLLAGARLVMAQPGGHQDSAYLVKLTADQQITTMHFVPSMLQVFLEEDGVENCNGLRLVISSGEALSVDLQKRFFERMQADLHNLYGPTEAAIDVTSWKCSRGSDDLRVPIGRPIANMQTYVLDGQLQPVPVGVTGELYIAGKGLARGYLNRPDLTAEKFIASPFGEHGGERLYRTGDLARFKADGSIDFLGRIDYQVKIRGFRIELGEIETALRQHDMVEDVVVVAREKTPGDNQLVAYIVCNAADVRTVGELRSYLREKLPGYMVPQAFVRLDSLPLTPSGKVDRRALPPADELKPAPDRPHIEPRTPVEKELVGILSELLAVKGIGIYDNFFELGGHSLLLTQLASRMRKAFDVQLPLRVLFDVPTVVEMTMAIAAKQIEQENAKEVEQMLNELKQLSPDQVNELLEAEAHR